MITLYAILIVIFSAFSHNFLCQDMTLDDHF